jgi:hypothetical protein
VRAGTHEHAKHCGSRRSTTRVSRCVGRWLRRRDLIKALIWMALLRHMRRTRPVRRVTGRRDDRDARPSATAGFLEPAQKVAGEVRTWPTRRGVRILEQGSWIHAAFRDSARLGMTPDQRSSRSVLDPVTPSATRRCHPCQPLCARTGARTRRASAAPLTRMTRMVDAMTRRAS